MNTDIVSHSAVKQQPPQDSFTVFLVDDDPDDLTLAKRILKSSDHIENVVCLTRPRDLFRELEMRSVLNPLSGLRSLILLDIHMPELGGIELLDQLKSSPYTENIPVVMLTGDHHTDNIEKTYRMNADAFIVKPLNANHVDHFQAILSGNNKRKEAF